MRAQPPTFHPADPRLHTNTAANLFIKFADDTAVVGLINNNDESNYRDEVSQLVVICVVQRQQSLA